MRRTNGKRERTTCHLNEGFTLVELLVVVSIIALMTSITLPALTRSQRNAEGIHCLANERQLMLAWLQYAIDSDDQICDPNAFHTDMKRYAPLDEVYICKAAQDGEADSFYGLSNTMGGYERDGVLPYTRLHQISHPSGRMVLVDVEAESHMMPRSCFWPLVRNDETWLWRPWSWPPAGNLQGMTARHNDGCNMSFADGHGEYRRWRDRRTLKMIKGFIADSTEASKDNVDLEFSVDILAK